MIIKIFPSISDQLVNILHTAMCLGSHELNMVVLKAYFLQKRFRVEVQSLKINLKKCLLSLFLLKVI